MKTSGEPNKLADWTDLIESPTFAEKPELQSLFPDGTLVVERFMGISVVGSPSSHRIEDHSAFAPLTRPATTLWMRTRKRYTCAAYRPRFVQTAT
jgi:hypothetical protein